MTLLLHRYQRSLLFLKHISNSADANFVPQVFIERLVHFTFVDGPLIVKQSFCQSMVLSFDPLAFFFSDVYIQTDRHVVLKANF